MVQCLWWSKTSVSEEKIFHGGSTDCQTLSRYDDQMEINKQGREFLNYIFYKLLDFIIGSITQRFQFSKNIRDKFQCIRTNHDEDGHEIENQCLAMLSV